MADGGNEGGQCMKRVLKIFAILLLIMAAGLACIHGFIWYQFHHYWEAEPKVEPVWGLAGHIRIRFNEQRPLPRSLDELLANLDPAQLEKVRGYPMIWNPDSDPMFVIRVNEKHGFIIDRGGSPGWLWQREQVSKHFPNY